MISFLMSTVSVGSSEEQNLPSVPLNDRNRLLGSLELNQDDVLKHNSIMEGNFFKYIPLRYSFFPIKYSVQNFCV